MREVKERTAGACCLRTGRVSSPGRRRGGDKGVQLQGINNPDMMMMLDGDDGANDGDASMMAGAGARCQCAHSERASTAARERSRDHAPAQQLRFWCRAAVSLPVNELAGTLSIISGCTPVRRRT
eukprot:3667644-Rhodomonas_salina.5